MWTTAATLMATLSVGAPLPSRVAVLMDDAAPGAPAVAAIEAQLQALGYEVVARDLAMSLRKIVTPQDVLEGRFSPDVLSVQDADAILAGSATYGPRTPAEGLDTMHATVTARLLDIATSRVSTTQQTTGVGMGAGGADLGLRGAKKAVEVLFGQRDFIKALEGLGQDSGAITLLVQGVPSRAALSELRASLERALAGAPIREIYYAEGLSKLLLGGSAANSMNGPEVADLLSANPALALTIGEVANTRIVAKYDRSKTVSVRAMVLEPTGSASKRAVREELGRFVAGELAKSGFMQSMYQAGKLTRAQAFKHAREKKFDLIVESEIMASGDALALAIRVLDVATHEVVLREQKPLDAKSSRFTVAEGMLGAIKTQLPERLAAYRTPSVSAEPAVAGAMK